MENNSIDSFKILNEDNLEYLFNLNNTDYFPFKPNNVNTNETKEFQFITRYNLLTKKIKRNSNDLKELDLKDGLTLKNLGNKKVKIFNIIHINNQSHIDIKEDIEKEKSKKETNFNVEKNVSKGIFLILKNEKNNNNNNNNFKTKKSSNDKSNKESKKMKHDKFTDDNLRKKCKYLLINNLMIFINKKIYSIYQGNIGNNIYRKELLTLNKSQQSNSNLIYDRLFVNKKISEILSDNISSRYTNFPPEHNKLLIEKLRKEEDEYKRIYFNKLFDLKIKDCLGYLIGKNSIEELDGMQRFDSIRKTLGEDEKYINSIKYYLDNFEKIIYNKIPRRPKNKKSTQIKYENETDI